LPEVQKIYDVMFFGAGPQGREKDFEELFIKPSGLLPHTKFAYAGGGGIWSWPKLATSACVEYLGDMKRIRFSDYKRLCCSSKINLNITRSPHKDVYASSVSRLFELASLGSCIVSNECMGIEEWFKVGKEVFVAHDSKEAVELYKYFLDDEEARLEAGRLARERVLREHTSHHRARELLNFIKNF
jgi:spore maturation protein CgeB